MAVVEQSRASKSSLRRGLDYAYLGFFLQHLVIMFAVDFASLYPDAIRPAILDSLRTYYVNTYHDKFFTAPPTWFAAYVAIEVAYHVPLSIWAIGALARDHPMVPLHLLIWAVLTFATTLTCLAEVWGWEDRTEKHKWDLTMLYAPYAAFAAFMASDMYCRLRGMLLKSKQD